MTYFKELSKKDQLEISEYENMIQKSFVNDVKERSLERQSIILKELDEEKASSLNY